MAENNNPNTEPQKTQRELFAERLRSRYPDQEFPDDEAMYGRAMGDYDDYEKSIEEYKGREARLEELFTRDPRSAQFLTDMSKGEDPWIGVVRRLGIDGVTDILNDPEKQEAYAEANKEYVERVAKEKKYEEEYQKNFGKSMELLASIQAERNLEDDVVDNAMDLVMRIANEAVLGKFTAETINMALNAINHDADVANAHEEGTVAGRNAKIDETLKRKKKGDGLPAMGGSNNSPSSQKNKKPNFFDFVEAAK